MRGRTSNPISNEKYFKRSLRSFKCGIPYLYAACASGRVYWLTLSIKLQQQKKKSLKGHRSCFNQVFRTGDRRVRYNEQARGGRRRRRRHFLADVLLEECEVRGISSEKFECRVTFFLICTS